MNEQVKELWIEALTSGRFKKGRGKLAKNGKHCCLGVLCELAIEQGVDVHRTVDEDRLVRFDGGASVLPASVRNWAGLPDDNPQAGDEPLAVWNDGAYVTSNGERGRPKPFRSIAKLIRQYL